MKKLALALAALLLLAGCGTAPAAGITTGTAGTTPAPSKTVTVFAAASLKATFTELGKTFEAGHPGVKVTFNFAGSQTLAEQITQGAPADAFASANEATMKTVTAAGLNAGEATLFATNRLTIAVPPTNPAGIATFADLAKPGLKLVVCAPAVPCGAATQTVSKATGVTLKPVSEEQSVTDVLGKVQTGEADAGLVYSTDVISVGGKVKGIDFPESSQAINKNSIVALRGGPQAALGQAFVDLVLSAEGRAVLKAAGFGSPA